MNKAHIKVIISALLIVSAVVYLIASGVSETGVYYRTVPEILSDSSSYDGENLRISGHVVPGSIDYDQGQLRLAFTISEKEDTANSINIGYKGVAPDAFEDGAEVIVEGIYTMAGNSFEATMVLAKCPSKYVAEDEEESI
jgi:cytochrome c-type biogenesis protein CcmE